MNKKQQELFVAFFQQIFEAQQIFQEVKKKLSACRNFNPYLLFQHISMGDQNDDEQNDPHRITIGRLRNYLVDKIACNQRQLYELFQKLDWERNGSISRQDFVKEVTPLDQDLRQNSSGAVTAEIQSYFITLVTEYIKRFRILQVLRKQVHFIWPYNVFIQIDNFKTGLIGLGQLKYFMQKNDFAISDRNLHLLLHGLRRRCYLQVNLQVFCQNLDPLQFGQYQNYRNNIDKQKQKQFLSRSRRQQETMRRSRIQSWKIQHNIAKQQRRRRAQKQRQLQLQQRINDQIKQHQKQKQRYIRRAMLEQDKNIRWNIQAGSHALELQKQRQIQQKLKNEDLNVIRSKEGQIKNLLVHTAQVKQNQIQNSRRIRYNLQRERQIQQQLQYKKELERRQYQLFRQRALEQDLQRQRQTKRRQYEARQRNLLGTLERQKQKQRNKFISEAQASRRIYQEQLRIQRERAQRNYELQRIRNQDYRDAREYEIASNSRRGIDLQRQLQRTRNQIRDRQSRINSTTSKRQPETAERDYRGYF